MDENQINQQGQNNPQGQNEQNQGAGAGASQQANNTPAPPPEKTFTQAEVTAMMTREKEQGRKSILSVLGVETAEDAKKAIDKLNELELANKSEAEKAQLRAKALEDENLAKVKEVQALSNKLQALSLGVNVKFVDDIVTLASSKVSAEKPFEAVIEEMKQSHPWFFQEVQENQGNQGTGSSKNPARGGKPLTGLGERLGKTASQAPKSSYFKK